MDTEVNNVNGWPRYYAPGLGGNAFDALEVEDGTETLSLRPHAPASVGLADQSLVAAVVNYAEKHAVDLASVVTNDEKLHGWVSDVMEEGVAILPLRSTSLIEELAVCGAITVAQAIRSFAEEDKELDNYRNPISPKLRAEKVGRIRQATTRLAGIVEDSSEVTQ